MTIQTKALVGKNKWLTFHVDVNDISGVVEPEKDKDNRCVILVKGSDITIQKSFEDISTLFNDYKRNPNKYEKS